MSHSSPWGRLRPRTLAGRFLTIVLLGVLLPLGVVGVWLTRSAERSGATLLRSQLDHSIDALSANAIKRWSLREGELQLLSNNSVTQSLLTARAISSLDSAYLDRLLQSMSGTLSSLVIQDVEGRSLWSFNRDSMMTRLSVNLLVADQYTRDIRVERTVMAADSQVGALIARIRLSSIVSTDSAQLFVPGALLRIHDSTGLLWSSANLPSASSVEGADWETSRRAPPELPISLEMSAPSAPYIQPFERAAAQGLGVLAVVAIVALILSIVLTSRVTRSMNELSVAASAVAQGRLDLRVADSGDNDVGRVATAFNQMTESLQRTLTELAQQRSLAAVGEFAASLSHEVRNSLTAVRVDLQHASRLMPPENPGAPLLARTLDSVRRLDSTVTSALRVARSGHVTRAPMSLDEILDRAKRATAPAFAEHAAHLDGPAANSGIRVLADGAALEQLFVNLLLNAAQSLSAGGRARLSLTRNDQHVTVGIEDTGRGEPELATADLDQPFRSSKTYGTGLGLPIAKRIAEAHGGELRVTHSDVNGTAVAVRLPRIPQVPKAVSSSASQ